MADPVAPWESCISCLMGDVTTVLVLDGEAEFIIALIHKAGGIPIEEANATFGVIAENEMLCDSGMVPVGRIQMTVRLCTDCAAKTGAQVVPLAAVKRGEPVFAYRQPDEGGRDDG